MSRLSRIGLAVASLLLLLAYVFPLWKISLEAPQYPEGLGMYIRINDVTGEKPHDLNNINNLNHYIGMKRIEPDTIPELVIMPWVVGFLIVFGLAAAALGRRPFLYAWVVLFMVIAIAGLVDFYLWEYDYGHNLDTDNAIIKVPGMNYQPPLIGTKQLLNFKAHSWPALGGWTIFLSLAAGITFSLREFLAGRRHRTSLPLAGLVVIPLLLSACAPEPRPIRYGEDACAFCMMTVSDERYGTEWVTPKGKVFVFDSIECLAAFERAGEEEAGSRWVTDFAAPGALISLEGAHFLHSPSLRSPMGMDLTAFGRDVSPRTLVDAYGGTVLGWDEVVALVASKDFGGMMPPITG